MLPYVQGKEKEADQESIVSYDYEKAKEVRWYDKILLNRPLKVIVALLLASILVPTLLFRYLFLASMDSVPSDGHSFGSCLVPRTSRVPCGAGNIPQEECHSQCCYDLVNDVCFHRFPSRFSYIVPVVNWTEEVVLTPRIPIVPFASQRSVTSLRLAIDEVSPTHLSIQVYDSRDMSVSGGRIDNPLYDYRVSTPELNIVVNASQGTIFNTIQGPLIASDNIWEMVFKLTDETMYGLGELPLESGTSKVVYRYKGGLSTAPLIFAKSNGSFHGLLLDVTTPSEIIVGDEKQISLRTMTRSGLKLHVFVGPEPKDIMRDVVSFIGVNKQLEYWMLGAHVCSEMSEDDDEALTHLTTFIANATLAGLPYESHCGTKPIVFHSDGSADASAVDAGAEAVKSAGKRFVPHIAPYIRYIKEEIENKTDDVGSNTTDVRSACFNIVCEFEEYMLQSPSSGLYLGLVNDYNVAYPDYGNASEDLLDRLWAYNETLDGTFLVDSWPLDQSLKLHNETEQLLPYFNENFKIAFNNIPQWNARWPQGEEYFYDHNEYGSKFVSAIEKKFIDTPIYSTSVWMKANAATNRQNVASSWTSLRRELVEAALGGISGQWHWTTPICGDTEHFDKDNQEHLCVKWYLAATYFPMIKIHAKNTPRDPIAFDRTRQNIMMRALNERLSLLPYLYTVLQQGPVLRPMFYQFPHSDLDDLNTQFCVGDHLMIVPNLQPSQTHVHIRIPPGTWFEFSGGLKIEAEENDSHTLMTTESDFITLICSRSIVVTQRDTKETAELTRKNSPFSLTIALERISVVTNGLIEIEVFHALGSLYMSSNMTVNFEVNHTELEITSEGDDFDVFCGPEAVWANMVTEIKIYGLDDNQNNYDNYRKSTTNIDLCDLKNGVIAHDIFSEYNNYIIYFDGIN
ncbi:probable maltase-glucoamylase 2 [Ostrinia nubilalis]|uniref:probable maltase-glucoamylase 2 n=1 Tax=Ostrinia nubilalis TaxID=29057 RepID=UPI0030825BE7